MEKFSPRSIPPTHAPSLFFTHGKRCRDQTFCTLHDGCYHVKSVPEMRGMFCIASCYGWLVLKRDHSTQCYLFNPVSLQKIHLPPLIQQSFVFGVLTCPPTDPNCVVVLISGRRKYFISCHVGDDKWSSHGLTKEKNHKLLRGGTHSVVSCQGKVYFFASLEEAVGIIDVHRTRPFIELFETELSESSIPGAVCGSSFFLESCGEIFRVRRVNLGASASIIQTLDVFKLDLSSMVWVKVESLGDRIFLLCPTCSQSVSATELGVEGNCIYFLLSAFTNLYKFHMDNGTITISVPFPNKWDHWEGPFWMVPSCELQVAKVEEKNVETSMKINEVRLYEDERNWEELPTEILELIYSFLFSGDIIRFRLTCKTWKSIVQPIRSYSLVQSEVGAQQIPWLLSNPKNNKSVYNVYHPIYSDRYTLIAPELAGAIVRHAKYGWLLMSKGKDSIFFYNPSTMEVINLPDHNYWFVNISFSSPPTSSNYTVFGVTKYDVSRVEMSVYSKEYDTWCDYDYESAEMYDFVASHCNPVFCDGVFYCLSKDGKLGSFNPQEEDYKLSWMLLPVPAVLHLQNHDFFWTHTRSFIMEYGGVIFAVFVCFPGKPVRVFSLDLSEMKWVKVESLEDKVIFLSHTTSMLVPAAGLKGIGNRIYLPKFHEKEGIYYSLSTGKYHYFGSKDCREDWINTWDHWNCTWFQSNAPN